MFLVQEKQCDQCLFTKNRIVSAERASEIIEKCRETDTNFVCHKGSLRGGEYKDLCCRAFWDAYKKDNRKLRMAVAFELAKFVNVE